jgi:hypothetical protein
VTEEAVSINFFFYHWYAVITMTFLSNADNCVHMLYKQGPGAVTGNTSQKQASLLA